MIQDILVPEDISRLKEGYRELARTKQENEDILRIQADIIEILEDKLDQIREQVNQPG